MSSNADKRRSDGGLGTTGLAICAVPGIIHVPLPVLGRSFSRYRRERVKNVSAHHATARLCPYRKRQRPERLFLRTLRTFADTVLLRGHVRRTRESPLAPDFSFAPFAACRSRGSLALVRSARYFALGLLSGEDRTLRKPRGRAGAAAELGVERQHGEPQLRARTIRSLATHVGAADDAKSPSRVIPRERGALGRSPGRVPAQSPSEPVR